MIRPFKLLFCDNEHGTGDITFPENFSEDLRNEAIQPRTVPQLRKDAKKAGWSRRWWSRLLPKLHRNQQQIRGERVMTLVTEPMNVHQAIRASKSGIAQRWNRRSKRVEYAKKTISGIRIVRSFTDPTVVRALSPGQELTRAWTPCDPKRRAA